MADGPTELPAYIQLRYQENGVFDSFASGAEKAAADAKKRFTQAFSETEKVVTDAVGRMSTKFSKLDLGVGDMRQDRVQLQQYRDALDLVSKAATKLAGDTSDTTRETREYLRALREQTSEAERALKVADAQITTYSRLQSALDKVGTASGPDLRDAVQRLRDGDAAIDRAALSGATLESVLGRVATKGREVSTALKEAAKAAEQAAKAEAQALAAQGPTPAGALPTNTKFGAEAIVSGQAALDRAAVSGATLEQVLGRVSTKGQIVTQTLAEMAAADQRAAAGNAALASAVDRLHAELDPVVAATQRYTSATDLLDKALAAGVIDGNLHAAMLEKVNSASRDGTTALRSVINSQGAFRVAMLQSGQQMQDIAVSLYGGQKAALVFAQQLPQLAFALSGLEGSANKTYSRIGQFATFMSGPWGLMVGLGVGVLATLTAEFFSAGDEADKAAKKTLDLGQAINQVETATKEALKALKDYNEAQGRARDNADSMIKIHLAEAQAKLENAKQTRALLQAELERRKQAVSDSSILAQPGEQQGLIAREKEISDLLASNQEQLDVLNSTRINLGIQDAVRDAQAAADPIKAINNRYDDMAEAAKLAAAATGELGNAFEVLGGIGVSANNDLSKSLRSVLTGIETQRSAAIKAAQEAKSAQKAGSGLFGREINSDAARSIAIAAGFNVTSGDRTRAEQQWLYDHKRTATNPVALPGTSAHEKGNALDIAFGNGVTPASIKKAYADAGVRLTKLLKEDGHFHIEWSTTGADKVQREADAIAKKQQQLAEFGDRAAETIQRINERFDEQPRLVDQTSAATRQLDGIIADLNAKMGDKNATPAMVEGFKKLVAEAEHAKDTVQDALVRPFRQLTQDSQRRVQIQTLLAQGREDEADAVQEIWRMQESIKDLTADQVQYIRDTVYAEKQRTRELQRQQVLFEAQLDVIDTARNSLTHLFSGRSTNFFKDVGQSLKDLQGKKLFDQLFGDTFRDLENELRGQSPLGKESQRLATEMNVATKAFDGLVDAVNGASKAFGGSSGPLVSAANDNPFSGFDDFQYRQALASILSGQTVGWHGGLNAPGAMSAVGGENEIVVSGKRPFDFSTRSMTDLAGKLSKAITDPFTEILSKTFGTSFGQMLGGIMQQALSGYMTGGATGGIIGGLKGIVDQTGIFGGSSGGLSGALGKAGSGAATGTMSAGIMKSLGLKTSTTGAQIGGAIGSFVPIPGGEIIGSVVGGLIGGLFKHNTTASAHVSNTGVTVQGADSGNYSTASGLGDSVASGLKNIVDQLGGTLGSYLVSIGTRGGEYRVNNTGSTSLKIKNGAVSFGDDEEAAIKYAIMGAIEDGAVQGIRASTKRLLQAGDDLDEALQDALDWENVFKELKSYKDPIGAALDDLDTEFEKLIDLSKEAGASAEEMAQLEELYGIKRNEIIKEQAEQLIGSLQDLYDSLTTGDNGLSLRDRESAALGTYNDLAARVAAGDTTAYDDYANSAQTLLDIERQHYGSQQEYFDRLNEVIDLTKNRIDTETNVVSIAENRDSPFDSTGAVTSSIDNQTDTLSSQLDAVNTNLGTISSQLASTTGGVSWIARVKFANSY